MRLSAVSKRNCNGASGFIAVLAPCRMCAAVL